MSKLKLLFTIILLTFVTTISAQPHYSYTTIPHDELCRRQYTLSNGLTVVLSEHHNEPRIACNIVIHTGSAHETDDFRGLAFLAAENFVSSEYMRLTDNWNVTSPKTHTFLDYTTIAEEIPSDRLEHWAALTLQRFSAPEFRLSANMLRHTIDLINRGLNDEDDIAYAAMRDALFPNHPYNRNTYQGFTEQLADTTLARLKAFYHTYYVHNNMVVYLSGDFDCDNAISILDKYLGQLKSAPIPDHALPKLQAINEPKERILGSKQASFINIGYRLDFPASAPEQLLLAITNRILYNGCNGLLDGDKPLKGTTYKAYSRLWILKENTILILTGHTTDGQSLTQAKELIMQQIEKLKRGDFPESILEAAKHNMQMEHLQMLKLNNSRTQMMALMNRQISTCNPKIWEGISKRDIVKFANKYLQNNYVSVITDPNVKPTSVEHIQLPQNISKLKNNDAECALIESILQEPSKPVSLNSPKADAQPRKLFTLSLTFPIGELHDLHLPYAAAYWQIQGTDKQSFSEVYTDWFTQACRYEVSCSDKTTTITLSGLAENTAAALRLLDNQIQNTVPDTHSTRLMVDNLLQQRQDAKKSLGSILNCLRNYCEYEAGLVKYQLNEEQIRNLDGAQLLENFRQLWQYQPEIKYEGPLSDKQIRKLIAKYIILPKPAAEPPVPKYFARATTPYRQIFFLPYATHNAHIVEYQCSEEADTSLVTLSKLYSEYFGNGNPSVLRQHLSRKGFLTGNCSAAYIVPQESDDKMYSYTYLTVPIDKIAEAIATLDTLDQQFAVDPDIFSSAQQKANAPDFTLDDVLHFHEQHIANRPGILMIIAPESAIGFIKSSGTPYTKLTMEDVFGY